MLCVLTQWWSLNSLFDGIWIPATNKKDFNQYQTPQAPRITSNLVMQLLVITIMLSVIDITINNTEFKTDTD